MIKIGIYVLTSNAKKNYKKECFNTRQNAGLAVVADILKNAGYMVEYISSANVHNYDIVLVSITSDCDWWEFVKERLSWQKGTCKVIVGGQGVLNVRPFLSIVDYFLLGRAENCLVPLINAIDKNEPFEHRSIVDNRTFNPNKSYYINQAHQIYPHDLKLENDSNYHEDIIGCNHKCLFCGYTWHRKFVNQGDSFNYSGLWNGDKNRERAIIDLCNGEDIDYTKLRTTAIDGMSERLRFAVNKKITREMLQNFIYCLHTYSKPHQVKFYNIIGYPNETDADYLEFIDDLKIADEKIQCKKTGQTSILLHSTPFRAMPATPMACEPMSLKNYRGYIGKHIGKNYRGNIFYQGKNIWAVESQATEGLSAVMMSAVILRGVEDDFDSIAKISLSSKFKRSISAIKEATLAKYFNIEKLFGMYKYCDLPTKYLKTYANLDLYFMRKGF